MLHLEMIAGFWFGIALRITIGIAVVSLLVTAFVRRFPKMPAEVRCGLWMVVILQGLLWFHVPVWIPPRPSASSAPAADRESSAPDQESTAASAGGQPGQVQTDGWAVLPAGAVPGEPRAPSTERASAHPAKSTEPLVARDGRWWPSLPISLKGALALVWITGVVGLTLLAVSRSWRFRRRVMARARAASAGLEEMARKLARRHGVLWRRGLRVLESDDCEVPMVVGVLRPMIVFPSGLSGLAPEQLESILAHELAHLRRADNVFAALSLCSCILNFFNPAVWWAERRLSTAREESADRWVTRMAGYPPKGYAEALLAVAKSVSVARFGWLAAGGRPSELRRRVMAVLEAAGESAPSSLWPARLFAVAIAAAVLISLVSVRESAPAFARSSVDRTALSTAADLPPTADDSSLLAPGSAEPTDEAKATASERPETKNIRPGDLKETATLEGHGGDVAWLAFSPDGTILASASRDGTVRLWGVPTGEPRGELTGHTHPWGVRCVAFSPDGRTLASCSLRSIRLWDVDSGALRAASDKVDSLRCLAYAPDGRILGVSSGGRVELRDAGTLEVLTALEAPMSNVRGVAFSPDGALMAAVGGMPGERVPVALWETATGRQLVSRMEDLGVTRAVAFSPDGTSLASGGLDRRVKLWDVPREPADTQWIDRQRIERLIHDLGEEPAEVREEAVGELVEIGFPALPAVRNALEQSESDEVRSAAEQVLGRISTPTFWPQSTLWGQGGDVSQVVFSPNGELLAAASSDPGSGGLVIWHVRSGAVAASIKDERHARTQCVAFSPDGRLLAYPLGSSIRLAELAQLFEGGSRE